LLGAVGAGTSVKNSLSISVATIPALRARIPGAIVSGADRSSSCLFCYAKLLVTPAKISMAAKPRLRMLEEIREYMFAAPI